MPHQCTTCGRSFPDGSKRMLSGCPDCGGNKFQFLPSDGDGVDAPPPDQPDDSPSPSPPNDHRRVQDDEGSPASPGVTREDHAQASARRAFVSEDELPPVEHDTTDAEESTLEADGDRPGLEELRAELNDQFESIKILRPGEYELNLMELYDRDEYIVALEEDGRYVIDVPNSWRDE